MPEEEMKDKLILSIDTETTGLDPKFHEVIQLAIVPILNFQELTSESLVIRLQALHPQRMTEKVKKIHNLNPTEGVYFKEGWNTFMEYVQSLISTYGVEKVHALGHNWQFDKGFIEESIGTENYESMFFRDYFDTKINEFLIMNVIGYDKSTSLLPSCERLGIKLERHHDALCDAKSTWLLFQKQMEFLTVAARTAMQPQFKLIHNEGESSGE